MPIKHANIVKLAVVLALIGVIVPGFAATTTPTSSTTPTHHTSGKTTTHSSGHHKKSAKKSRHRASHKSSVHKTALHSKAITSHSSHKESATSHKHVTHHHTRHTTHPITPATPVTSAVPTTEQDNVSDSVVNTNPVIPAVANTTDTSTSSNTGERLVTDVHHFISSLRYTHYKSGGEIFDSAKGIYELDCSHYVDNILERGAPAAYSNLVSSTGATSPNSANYYNFFTRLSTNFQSDWDRVDNANDLQPGDVLVFRYRSSRGAEDGGHVMLVMDKPVQDNNALLVRVSDSAFAGHSDDTRLGHKSGVGIGTLVLKVDQLTGQPFAYAWNIDSPWQNRVDIAMGRPVDVG